MPVIQIIGKIADQKTRKHLSGHDSHESSIICCGKFTDFSDTENSIDWLN